MSGERFDFVLTTELLKTVVKLDLFVFLYLYIYTSVSHMHLINVNILFIARKIKHGEKNAWLMTATLVQVIFKNIYIQCLIYEKSQHHNFKINILYFTCVLITHFKNRLTFKSNKC